MKYLLMLSLFTVVSCSATQATRDSNGDVVNTSGKLRNIYCVGICEVTEAEKTVGGTSD